MFCHPMQDYTRDGFRFHADFDMALAKMAFHIIRDGDRETRVRIPQGAKLTWVDLEQGRIPEPTFACDTETMQHLFNALWDCGYRPNGGARSEAVVAAKDAHLDDLRKIVTKLLDSA